MHFIATCHARFRLKLRASTTKKKEFLFFGQIIHNLLFHNITLKLEMIHLIDSSHKIVLILTSAIAQRYYNCHLIKWTP